METSKPLYRKLNHWRIAVREEAIAEAKSLPPDQLIAFVAYAVERGMRQEKRFFMLNLLFICTSMGILFLGHRFWNHLPDVVQWCIMGGQLGVAAYLFLQRHCTKQSVKLLAELEDARFLGAVLDMIRASKSGLLNGRSLFPLLKRHLQKTPLEALHRLTPEQKRQIAKPLEWEALGFSVDREFKILIIKALEQVGGEACIPTLARLAAEGVNEAVECIPVVRARAEQAKVGATLLRPSSLEEVAPETLLRPSAPTVEPHPEQLLRPSAQ